MDDGTSLDRDAVAARQATFEENLNEADGPLTTKSLKAILQMHLKPIRDDIEAIKKHGISKGELEKTMKPLESKVDDLTEKVHTLESSMTTDIEDIQIRMTNMENELKDKMEYLEKRFGNVSTGTPRSLSGASYGTGDAYHYHGKRAVTAVIGNLEISTRARLLAHTFENSYP